MNEVPVHGRAPRTHTSNLEFLELEEKRRTQKENSDRENILRLRWYYAPLMYFHLIINFIL